MTIAASRIRAVRGSDTKAMTARAAALRAAGRSVITLSQGEPDFDTPPHVVEAGRRALDEGRTRYTAVAGIAPLREAISAKLERDDALRYASDDITVGCGAKQVIANALLASLEPGDEVIVPAPCWVSYPEIVRLAGGVPVIVSTIEHGFRLVPESLERALSPRTRWLVLNSPCNPTGVVYGADELRALAAVLERHPRVWVLSDDIYEKLILDDVAFATMASAAPAIRERTLTVNGLSKSHAMTGWRVGYGAGPRELIRAMNVVQSHTTSHASSVAQYAAVAALTGDDSFLDGCRATYRARRDLVLRALAGVPGLHPLRPEGAFYVFVGSEALIGARTSSGVRLADAAALAMHLLESAGVAVVAGAGFHASPYFRISFATSTADVAEGCARIAHACRALERSGVA